MRKGETKQVGCSLKLFPQYLAITLNNIQTPENITEQLKGYVELTSLPLAFIIYVWW